MKLFCIVIAFFTIGESIGQNNTATEESKAEQYFLEGFTILNSTTHNALSRELALEVLDYANKAIAINPKVSKYYRIRGTSYFHLKEYEAALTSLDKALEIDPDNALAWMGRGIVFENTQRYDLAEKSYFKALEYDKDDIGVYFNFGKLYSKWGKKDLAIQAYDKALEIHPGYASAYINRGEVKLLNRQYKEAVSDFNAALSLDPEDKVSYNNRGLCRFYLKEYESAIFDFETALKIRLGKSFDENFDTDKYSYNNMANAYLALGKTSKACEFWTIALNKGYQYKKEWKALYNIDDPNELIKKYCK